MWVYSDHAKSILSMRMDRVLWTKASEESFDPAVVTKAALRGQLPTVPVRDGGLGVITIVWVIGGGSTTLHYIFFATIEVVCTLFIVWYAWTWRKSEGHPLTI